MSLLGSSTLGASQLFVVVQGVHPQKEAIVFGGPLILIIHVSWFHIDLNQLENEATPQKNEIEYNY